MEEIFNNMFSPSWWFNGIFFGVIVPVVIKKFPLLFKIAARNRLAKWKRRIKNASHSQALLSYEVAKTNSLFLTFFITCSLYLVWFLAGSLNSIIHKNIGLFLIVIMPIYIAEIIWLLQEKITLEAISRNNMLRIKRARSKT